MCWAHQNPPICLARDRWPPLPLLCSMSPPEKPGRPSKEDQRGLGRRGSSHPPLGRGRIDLRVFQENCTKIERKVQKLWEKFGSCREIAEKLISGGYTFLAGGDFGIFTPSINNKWHFFVHFETLVYVSECHSLVSQKCMSQNAILGHTESKMMTFVGQHPNMTKTWQKGFGFK